MQPCSGTRVLVFFGVLDTTCHLMFPLSNIFSLPCATTPDNALIHCSLLASYCTQSKSFNLNPYRANLHSKSSNSLGIYICQRRHYWVFPFVKPPVILFLIFVSLQYISCQLQPCSTPRICRSLIIQIPQVTIIRIIKLQNQISFWLQIPFQFSKTKFQINPLLKRVLQSFQFTFRSANLDRQPNPIIQCLAELR